jgi:hypothetical protein
MEQYNLAYLLTSEIFKSPYNNRVEIIPWQVNNMKQTLLQRQPLPPISVYREGDKYSCYDGWHRLTAHKELGFTHIHAMIHEKISSNEAKYASFNYNCGNGWTEADKARICLEHYRKGEDPKTIANGMPTLGNQETVTNYIKIAGYLHPELLKHISKGSSSKGNICFSAAKLLTQYDPNIQKQLYDIACNYGGTSKPNFERLIMMNQCVPNNNCIIGNLRTIVPIINANSSSCSMIGSISSPLSNSMSCSSTPMTNSNNTSEFTQHIDSIADTIKDLSSIYKCNYNYILSQIQQRLV